MIEAKDSVDRLCSLVEKHYQEMSQRLLALEQPELEEVYGGQHSDDDTVLTPGVYLNPGTRPSSRTHEPGSRKSLLLKPDFTEDLETSRVYRRLPNWRSSMLSVCTGTRSASWSILSGLSLTDISNISVINLVITTDELYEPTQYCPRQSIDGCKIEERPQSTHSVHPRLPHAGNENAYSSISQHRNHVTTQKGKPREVASSIQAPWSYSSSSSYTSSFPRTSYDGIDFLIEGAHGFGGHLSPEQLASWWSLTLNTRVDVLTIQPQASLHPGGRLYYLSSACGVDDCSFSLNRDSRSLEFEFCKFSGNFSQRKLKKFSRKKSSYFNPWFPGDSDVFDSVPIKGLLPYSMIRLEFSVYQINLGVAAWETDVSHTSIGYEYICQIQNKGVLVGVLECVLHPGKAGHSQGNDNHVCVAELIWQSFLTKLGWYQRMVQISIRFTATPSLIESVPFVLSLRLG